MQSFIFSILSVLSFAAVNIVDGYILRRIIKSPFIATQVLGFFSLVIFIVALPFHWETFYRFNVDVLLLIFSGVFEAFYIYKYLQAIEGENISYVVSIFSLAPLFILAFEFFTGVPIKILMVIGIVMIISGVILLVRSTSQMQKERFDRFTQYAFIATFLYGLSLLIAHAAIDTYEPIISLLISRLGVALGAGVIFVFLKIIKKETHKSLFQLQHLWFVLPELLYVVAIICMFIALLNNQSTSYVATVLAIQPLFVFLILRILDKKNIETFTIEKKLNRKKLFIVAITIITFGSIVINIHAL